jgi:glutathione S-transferase
MSINTDAGVVLKVHHLNNSRSQKTLWLLEELGLAYVIVPYQRDSVTMMGPPALKALHPMGKAPVLEEDGRLLFESGAICDYILTRYANGRLKPDPQTLDYMYYVELLYFAVAAGMNPIMIKVYSRAFGLSGTPIDQAADAELSNVLHYIESKLVHGPYLLGEFFSAADIQLSFVPELARALSSIDAYPNICAWLDRLYARPAFHASITRGGDYAYGKPISA